MQKSKPKNDWKISREVKTQKKSQGRFGNRKISDPLGKLVTILSTKFCLSRQGFPPNAQRCPQNNSKLKTFLKPKHFPPPPKKNKNKNKNTNKN